MPSKTLLFNSLRLIILLGFPLTVMSEKLTATEVQEQVLQQFKEYRHGVAIKLSAKELRKYFSKETNEYWLDLLIEANSLERTLEVRRSIKYRLRFGWWVTNIYEYSVTQKSDTTWTLTFIYDMDSTEKKSTYEIDYTLSSGEWLIGRVLHDSTELDKNYLGKVSHRFSKISEY